MQGSYKLYMMLGVSCILNCCTNKVPLTAIYLCLFLSLRLYQVMLPAEIYIANLVAFGEMRMAIVCQIFKIWYSPVQIPQKIRSCIHSCCQSCSSQVFLSAGSFRIATAGRCKFCPFGVRCRLLETGA